FMQNKKQKVARLIRCLFLLCLLVIAGKNGACQEDRGTYTLPRHIVYRFTLQNTTNQVIPAAELWTYAPVEHTATQHSLHLETSHPSEVLLDALGNRILHFTFKELPPYATKIVTITSDLFLSETPKPLPENDVTPYLPPEQYCESDDPDIVQLAQHLHTSTPAATVENIF
ncbi:MAG: hypothetical protein GY807_00470, partial [Gammaproteobacteria bacterium]|nr:hypothetical protein [Gammaproteobacteria bacterium]